MTRSTPDPEPERLLAALDLEEHLRDPRRKQRFVTAMFEVVSRSYDRFTRAFSYGMDVGWKRELLAEARARVPAGARVVDLACGTGDLAFGVEDWIAQSTVLGIDVSRRMVALARTRADGASRVRFLVGDLTRLPAPDHWADAITVGYGIRNAPHHQLAVEEIARVLRPGGWLFTLDFFRPEQALWRGLFLTYLRLAGNLFGWIWHRRPVAYGYIAPSIRHFISWQAFRRVLQNRGFTVHAVRRKLLGGVCLHVAQRERRPEDPR